MLTPLTQQAITVLRDIASHNTQAIDSYRMTPEQLALLLARLECKRLIDRIPGEPIEQELSYKLSRPLAEVSLLDVLEALNEHLNCNRPNTEEFYNQYGRLARKLGVVNHMTRLYLSEIKLIDY